MLKYLLSCATADSIIRKNRSMPQNDQIESVSIWEEYFQVQKHSSLKDLIQNHMKESEHQTNTFNHNLIQITTNSRSYMSNQGFLKLATDLNFQDKSFCLLQSFETQKQFSNHVKKFLNTERTNDSNRLLVIQSDFTRKVSADLETARHTIIEKLKESMKQRSDALDKSYILLVINLARENTKYFNGFQVGYWTCYHIDELDEVDNYLPSFDELKGNTNCLQILFFKITGWH